MFVIIQQLFTNMKICGLDVHKDMIFCAIYDRKDSEVKKYDTFTPDFIEVISCRLIGFAYHEA